MELRKHGRGYRAFVIFKRMHPVRMPLKNPQGCSLWIFYVLRSVVFIKYKNAKTILPEYLLRELQQYVQGEIIYVPGSDSSRAGWGEANGTKEKYDIRNKEIIMLYKSGVSKEAIAVRYHLSEYSIKKIIHDNRDKVLS